MVTFLVSDPDDSRLEIFRRNERGWCNRTDRRDDSGAGLFLAEGDLVVQRSLEVGYTPVAALVDQHHVPAIADRVAATAPVYLASGAVQVAFTGLALPSPIVAVFHRKPRPTVEELASRSRRLVVIEAVDNPVNIGGIARNAAGLGWDGLVLDHTSADPLARRSLRVSMGQAAALPHARTGDLLAAVATLARHGFDVVALTPNEPSVDISTVDAAERLALVIGSERSGISPLLLAAAAARVRIPMHAGVDSLNAAAATAIACYALRPRASSAE